MRTGYVGRARAGDEQHERCGEQWLTAVHPGTLAGGTHTLRIECTGLKNESSTGTTVRIDAFDILGTLVTP